MIKLCKRKTIVFLSTTLLILLFGLQTTHAAQIGLTDIWADGGIFLDNETDATATPPLESFTFGSVEGDFSKIEGGATTTSEYDGEAITSGTNPLSGDFSAVGDGFGLSGSASATDDEFAAFIGFALDLENMSGVDTYKITVEVDFSNFVEATGPDSFSASEFAIFDSFDDEIFFSHFVSDTLAPGNEENGIETGVLGGPIGELDTIYLDILLAPTETDYIYGGWLLDGGEYADDGIAAADFSAAVTIFEITNLTNTGPDPDPIPEPGTLFLFGAGLLAVAGCRRKV